MVRGEAGVGDPGLYRSEQACFNHKAHYSGNNHQKFIARSIADVSIMEVIGYPPDPGAFTGE